MFLAKIFKLIFHLTQTPGATDLPVMISRSMRIILFALFLALAAARAPDTSLETTPVAYYGANWNRSQVNIDVLAKMQMVVLMQEDGHCWATSMWILPL